jgi:hypothetical protein
LHGERLSEAHWKTLANEGFQHTRELVPVSIDVLMLPSKHGCEGKMHRALKKTAAEMLAKLGENQVKLEHDGFDVYGATLGIAVECGSMPLTKIYEALTNNKSLNIKEIWHLSFPKPEYICTLTKIKLITQPCNYFNHCKPNEWSKREMSNCKLNGKECYIRIQYQLRDCLHLNGYETLTSSNCEATN